MWWTLVLELASPRQCSENHGRWSRSPALVDAPSSLTNTLGDRSPIVPTPR